MKQSSVMICGQEVKLTNLDKLLWPEGLSKAHLIKYYSEVAPYILPHLYNRPLVMKRYPDGLQGEPFYQKECPNYAPAWIQRHPVEHSEKVINYIICNDTATLLWLANQACIEMHAWLGRVEDLESPDLAVMDLDPAEGATFSDVLEVAVLFRRALDQFGLQCFPKTSGSSGLHLFIPLKPGYTWQQVTGAMKFVAEILEKVYPDRVTTQRAVGKRDGRVYLDYLQNGRGKTMAFQYSLRPLPGAPVSTPLHWWEVEKGGVHPGNFTMTSIFQRLRAQGDIFRHVLYLKQTLDDIIKVC